MIILPQPYIGVPGAGVLTLTFLGEAGVVGRPDMTNNAVVTGANVQQKRGLEKSELKVGSEVLPSRDGEEKCISAYECYGYV